MGSGRIRERVHLPGCDLGRLQAEHLIDRGRRRLGYALPADPVLRPRAESRLADAARAVAEIDLPVALETGIEIADAASAVTGWTERDVTRACADIAVIGADDIPTVRLAAPLLTTVAFDLREVGRHRAEAVAAGLAGNDSRPALARTSERVVERSST